MEKLFKTMGLFGSSFDPPHLGHLAVLEDLGKNAPFDEIWLVPVFNHPFGKPLSPYDIRLKMAEMLWASLNKDKFSISTIEKDLGKPASYAYDVIKALKAKYPSCRFSIILGTDARKHLEKWHRPEDLKKEADFYFIPRKGYDESSPYPEVSSTEIRENVRSGRPVDHLTTPRIARFIVENKLYV